MNFDLTSYFFVAAFGILKTCPSDEESKFLAGEYTRARSDRHFRRKTVNLNKEKRTCIAFCCEQAASDDCDGLE